MNCIIESVSNKFDLKLQFFYQLQTIMEPFIIEDFLKLQRRIDKKGVNCNIGDIITWSMRKNKEQLYGIITKKCEKSVTVDLLEYTIYDHAFHLNKITKLDQVCYNKLLYTRKLMIVKPYV
jgi:hypothetical protein